ncbi:MAG TPA: GDP-mannose 4,6-dehydratase [Pyrinomonadaceae bacterium]|nr:GDP-mannose 4,6-dehydratase [Pyrinomonadaceae bacterium]
MELSSSFWKDRPVFVTGATGLLGSWMTRKLVDLGAYTVVLVRDWVPESELIANAAMSQVTVIRGDLTDQELLERVLNEYEISTVFHLAAQTIVGTANRGPVSTFESNIRGTWCLLEAARGLPLIEQIVVASSDKAYGDHEKLPYDEDAPLQGRHPYDVSKSCVDLISQSYAHSFDMPITVTRCGNLYGGGDLNWNRLIPGTIRSVIRGEQPIIRSDGTFIRDYFYVEDAAIAYIRLAEQMAQNADINGHAFNFSNEIQVSVLDLTRQILKLMQREDLEPIVRDEVRNEIKHQYLSAEKARRVLDWRPEFSLEQGLERTIGWYRNLLA